jgi:hypothetical protein
MLAFEPWPMASIAITAATPITIPSMVRKERSEFLLIAEMAIFIRLYIFIESLI